MKADRAESSDAAAKTYRCVKRCQWNDFIAETGKTVTAEELKKLPDEVVKHFVTEKALVEVPGA